MVNETSSLVSSDTRQDSTRRISEGIEHKMPTSRIRPIVEEQSPVEGSTSDGPADSTTARFSASSSPTQQTTRAELVPEAPSSASGASRPTHPVHGKAVTGWVCKIQKKSTGETLSPVVIGLHKKAKPSIAVPPE